MDNSGSDSLWASFQTPTLLMSDKIKERKNRTLRKTMNEAIIYKEDIQTRHPN